MEPAGAENPVDGPNGSFWGELRVGMSPPLRELRPVAMCRGDTGPSPSSTVMAGARVTRSSAWRPDSLGLSRGLAVLMDEAAAATVGGDGCAGSEDGRRGGGSGRLLVQRSVWSMDVVVLDVLVDETVELLPIPDQRAIQELAAQGAYPPLGVGRWPPVSAPAF